MKKVISNLTVKQIVLTVVILLCLLLWGGLTIFGTIKKHELLDQNVSTRWSDEKNVAQVSCFFTEGTEINKDTIMTFEHTLDNVLLESSITAENEKANLWVDAYSSQGTITLNNGKSSLETDAVGIGGDFFMFHPVQLLKGAYFSGNDLMTDKIIIDEDAAWRLFGSNDVIGMEVTIDGIPHYINGVIKRDEGRINEAAGLDTTLVYVSCETLEQYGKSEGINCYEIVMPNPVSGFAYEKIKEKFALDENQMWVVENSTRYGIKSLFTVFAEFGTRSMNAHAIKYPYWENIARGWEDIFAVVLILQVISLLIPAIILIVTLVILWKRKRWTWKDVILVLQAVKDKVFDKFHKQKNKWKDF